MSLTAGTSVGRYEIRELLGTGGMGEVYKAHDSTLGRSVAIKVLHQAVSADAAGVARFLQEARAASALNHPNILTIHEVGDHQTSRFIVSELVEGETLRQRLARGPLTLREVLDIVAQTASALAAAHAAGIVHRDIKPENVMLRPDGFVKVLDFGVAKLAGGAVSDAEPGATIAPRDTAYGMVVGTVAYMSPEQARGLNVDGRADAFSLGVMLYELVTGRTPFAGPTPTDTLVAILDKDVPPARLLARGLPPPLEWAINKALEKDPNLRYQSIADLRVDLLRLKAAIDAGRLGDFSAATQAAQPIGDQPIEIALTADSAPVRAIGVASPVTIGLAAVGLVTLVAALVLYDRGHLGADLPLQVPEGAVLTKARDAALSLGYPALPARSETQFEGALSVSDVTALAGLAEAREAVRAGVVAHWAVGASPTRDPNVLVGDGTPQEGEFAIRLNPNGQIVSFVTGLSQTGGTVLERDNATQLGLETIRRIYGIDATGYELEYVQRAFPAGTVEMTWRNPVRRFGHVEQIHVHLQSDRMVRVARTFEKPPGYTEPTLPMAARIIKPVVPWLVGAAFVVPYAFGLYVLIKTKSWDALRQRLPIALCSLIVASVGIASTSTPGWQVLLGLVFIVLLMISTGLPAVSGILLWIRRRTPARLWAADELTHGRVVQPAVSMSIIEGAAAGAAMAAIQVLAETIGISIPGYLPSISREVSAVDDNLWTFLSDATVLATFLAIGIALAVEALDRARVPAAAAAALIATGLGLVVGVQHQSVLAALPAMAGQAGMAALGVLLYRTRGLLAIWIAVVVSELLPDAMAARALDDPSLVSTGNIVIGVAAVILAIGVGGLVAGHVKRSSAQPPSPAA
jgi:hypothetical protein